MSNLNPYSLINNSSSKAMYSFSRSSRPSMAKKLYCDTFYQIPQTKSKRKASIGYGKKIDWDDLNKTKKEIPAPTNYKPQDFIAVNKSTRKGFTAGIGRQETKSQSFIQFDKSVPGPQRYQVHNAEHEGPKYSMRPRTTSQTFVKTSSKVVPGPGKYNPISSINPEGRYCISKWESSKSKRFDPKNSSRFMKTKTQAPGPGEYTPRNSAWENGNLAESKYVSQGNRVFATGNRSTIFEDEPKKFKDIPGPGMYESFSDFGSIMETPGRKTNRRLRQASSKLH